MNQEIRKQIKAGKFPDCLTFDQFDDMGWESKQFGLDDDRSPTKIVEDVIKYALDTKGQIYTQVDGDTDRVYSKGLRFVNRTGLYEVVTGQDLEVDNK